MLVDLGNSAAEIARKPRAHFFEQSLRTFEGEWTKQQVDAAREGEKAALWRHCCRRLSLN